MTTLEAPVHSEFRLGDLTCTPDPSGALWIQSEQLLVVADLHFEKGSAFARRGSLLPPYDSRETLARLAKLTARLKPKTILALGDTWHDGGGHGRMDRDDSEAFAQLRQGVDWIFIAGNHDPEPPRDLGAMVAQEFTLKGVTFRHEPDAQANTPEIAGHLHPAAKVAGRGRPVRRKCFISSEARCILPAFGSYAGGLNVLDRAFDPLFARHGFTAHLIGADRVYAIGPASLVPDGLRLAKKRG
jgi:DNA ligase-associated metallophosphoesterase